MANCVMCGEWLPENQGSKTCSMCYGDPAHGKDGYYQSYLDRQEQEYREKQEREYRDRQENEHFQRETGTL